MTLPSRSATYTPLVTEPVVELNLAPKPSLPVSLNASEFDAASTLEDLPRFNCAVDLHATGALVGHEFEREVYLPGVIVVDQDQIGRAHV